MKEYKLKTSATSIIPAFTPEDTPRLVRIKVEPEEVLHIECMKTPHGIVYHLVPQGLLIVGNIVDQMLEEKGR